MQNKNCERKLQGKKPLPIEVQPELSSVVFVTIALGNISGDESRDPVSI